MLVKTLDLQLFGGFGKWNLAMYGDDAHARAVTPRRSGDDEVKGGFGHESLQGRNNRESRQIADFIRETSLNLSMPQAARGIKNKEEFDTALRDFIKKHPTVKYEDLRDVTYAVAKGFDYGEGSSRDLSPQEMEKHVRKEARLRKSITTLMEQHFDNK